MSITPIVKNVIVNPPPERAFSLFVSQMGRWWPKERTPGKNPAAEIVVEPYVGGRWFEQDAEGNETMWGEVLAYEPPRLLLLGWKLDRKFTYDPDLITEVEITFSPAEGGGTAVRLEHRNLERFGADAEQLRGLIDKGWPERLADFKAFAERAS